MPRLIDADKLLDILDVMIVGHKSASDVFDVVEDMPTVDAVEVVRCKDCIHREVQVDGVFRYEICGLRGEIINLEGFCHMGKRRKE